jgi:hypothetical protein
LGTLSAGRNLEPDLLVCREDFTFGCELGGCRVIGVPFTG